MAASPSPPSSPHAAVSSSDATNSGVIRAVVASTHHRIGSYATRREGSNRRSPAHRGRSDDPRGHVDTGCGDGSRGAEVRDSPPWSRATAAHRGPRTHPGARPGRRPAGVLRDAPVGLVAPGAGGDRPVAPPARRCAPPAAGHGRLAGRHRLVRALHPVDVGADRARLRRRCPARLGPHGRRRPQPWCPATAGGSSCCPQRWWLFEWLHSHAPSAACPCPSWPCPWPARHCWASPAWVASCCSGPRCPPSGPPLYLVAPGRLAPRCGGRRRRGPGGRGRVRCGPSGTRSARSPLPQCRVAAPRGPGTAPARSRRCSGATWPPPARSPTARRWTSWCGRRTRSTSTATSRTTRGGTIMARPRPTASAPRSWSARWTTPRPRTSSRTTSSSCRRTTTSATASTRSAGCPSASTSPLRWLFEPIAGAALPERDQVPGDGVAVMDTIRGTDGGGRQLGGVLRPPGPRGCARRGRGGPQPDQRLQLLADPGADPAGRLLPPAGRGVRALAGAGLPHRLLGVRGPRRRGVSSGPRSPSSRCSPGPSSATTATTPAQTLGALPAVVLAGLAVLAAQRWLGGTGGAGPPAAEDPDAAVTPPASG